MFVEKNRKYLNIKVFNSGKMLVKDMIHLPEYERPHKCDVCERISSHDWLGQVILTDLLDCASLGLWREM